MSFNGEDFNRKVIPIWDGSKIAAGLVENTAIKQPAHIVNKIESSAKLIAELERTNSVGVALELLSIAKIEKNDHGARISANRIVEDGSLPNPVLSMARSVLSESFEPFEITTSWVKIKRLRDALRASPRNALGWIDLAREYIIAGQGRPAERAMRVALALAPGHRWVTRVASRMYVHLGELEKSYEILAAHGAIRTDPWLASAEIAVAQLLGKPSRNVGAAKKILEQRFHPSHTVELSSSLATLELEHGAIKKAKAHFRESLLHPNRNSLAQAVWAEKEHDIRGNSRLILQSFDAAYEARSWECYMRGDVDSAFINCNLWYESEPYASQPPILGTFLAALADRYQEVIDLADSGLITNPDSYALKLNKAFAEIAMLDPGGDRRLTQIRVNEWIALFEESAKIPRHRGHALANFGMLCYRVGYPEQGRLYYEHAENICDKEGHNNTLMCVIYHAREALLARVQWADEIVSKARELCGKSNDPSRLAAVYYMEKIELLKQNGNGYREIFKLDDGGKPRAKEEYRVLDFGSSIQEGLTFLLPKDF